jgi:hypothetical protein
MAHEQDGQIMIGPDGTILAVTGESLPPHLVDRRLEDCPELSREVRDAGRAVLEELRHSDTRAAVRSLTVDSGSRLQLMAIDVRSSTRGADHGTTVKMTFAAR